VSLLGSLFSTLRYFINTYPQTLFRWTNTSYCGDLCFEILRHCNLPHAVVRAKAAALFYLLIKARIPHIHVLLAGILIVLCRAPRRPTTRRQSRLRAPGCSRRSRCRGSPVL
jgi:hypothetical protein